MRWVRMLRTAVLRPAFSAVRMSQPTASTLVGAFISSTSSSSTGDSSLKAGPTTSDVTALPAAIPRQKREYPSNPRVGVGVVVFRSLNSHEVLVVRRAKEPSKGMWSFPGGGLELGETIRSCAVREVLEETGVRLRDTDDGSEAFSTALSFPTAFAASDSITLDENKRIQYQYAIIEVAALAEDPHVTLIASDDVDAAMWMDVRQLRQLPNLTPFCSRFAEEALERFFGGTARDAHTQGQPMP